MTKKEEDRITGDMLTDLLMEVATMKGVQPANMRNIKVDRLKGTKNMQALELQLSLSTAGFADHEIEKFRYQYNDHEKFSRNSLPI